MAPKRILAKLVDNTMASSDHASRSVCCLLYCPMTYAAHLHLPTALPLQWRGNFCLLGLWLFCLLQAPSCLAQADLSPDTILTLHSQIFNNTRSIRVLLPPGYQADSNRHRRYPVIYLNDGFAVFKTWQAKPTVHALIISKQIEPIILVGIGNAMTTTTTVNARTREYLPYSDPSEPEVPHPEGSKYPDFMVKEVMPLINGHFRTLTGPAYTAIGGSSYGGYCAFYTFITRPDVFSRLLMESTPLFLASGQLVTDARKLKAKRGKIYIGLGTKETPDSVILQKGLTATQDLIRLLEKRKIPHHFVLQENAEHNSKAWRARLPQALLYLYSPTSASQ